MNTRPLLDWRAAGLLRLGEDAQDEERYADASRYYEEVLRVAKDHEPARFNLGVTELRRGRAERASEIFHALLDARPAGQRPPSHDLPILVNLALAHACAGALPEAYKLARGVVVDALEPSSSEKSPSPLRRRIEGPAVALLAVVGARLAGNRPPPPPRRDRRVQPPSRDELLRRLHNEPTANAETAALAAEIARDAPADESRTHYFLACYEAQRNAPELALDELESALTNDPRSIEWARRDPLLEPLRAADPREFRTVIRWARTGRAARPTRLGDRATPTPDV